MRLVYDSIALVEEGDNLQTIAKWITDNTDVSMENNETAFWVNVVKPGCLFLFEVPYGRFRFHATVTEEARKALVHEKQE